MSSSALKKALYSLFGDSVPSEGEIDGVAHRIFREVVESTPDGDEESITKNDMYHYLVKKSPVSGLPFLRPQKIIVLAWEI